MRQLRFYEKNPTVKQAVTLLFKFPTDVRTVLAKGFCAIAENDFSAHIKISDRRSLGPEKVLALYKSTQKRREYDDDPYLSRAMNYLMILSPSEQFFLSVKLMDLMVVVRDFMVVCKRHAIQIQIAAVEKLTNVYVKYGLNEAEDLLQNINTRLKVFAAKMGAPQPAEAAPQEADVMELRRETITERGAAMKITPDMGMNPT